MKGYDMTPREKLVAAINHEKTGKFPFDLGACKASGISASLLHRLRKAHGRDEPVKVYDIFQMLGLVDERDAEMFGIDVVGIWPDLTCFGYRNTNWKSWTLPDGTPGLVSDGCEMSVAEDGTTYVYPQGDRTAKPSGKLPPNGFYFDQISRQEGYDEDDLNALRDYDEQFALFDDETLEYYLKQAEHYHKNTNLGVVVNTECAAFGSATQIIGPMLKQPTGIRDIGDFLMSHHLYPDYLNDIFTLQTDRALENLKRLWDTIGDMAQVVFLSGTDFGNQRSTTFSPGMFKQLYYPHYSRVNAWVHENTTWKILYHSCGAVADIMGDFCDAGLDCLNPIQCDADGMDPADLKRRFGDRLTFWGAGVDSQSTMMNGTADDVERQMRERIGICGEGGGMVFSIVHNVQPDITVEKMERVFSVLDEYR